MARLRDSEGVTEGRGEIRYCEPEHLKVDESYNIRDLTTPKAMAELEELYALIKEKGVQTPLRIRFDGETKTIVEGHRRHLIAMRLKKEFKESKGAEGRNIKSVPIYAEAQGTTDLDRAYGLRHSNSGTPLEPLEFANLIYRTMEQHGLSEQVAAKGFGISVVVLRNHLKMRGMTEEVKQQVRDGDISATLAVKITKEVRDAKKDPKFAAELIAANKAQNKAIKGDKKNARTKVTRKTIERDRPKAAPTPPQPVAPPIAIEQIALQESPAYRGPPDALPAEGPIMGEAEFLERMGTQSCAADLPSAQRQIHQHPGIKELIEALRPFAGCVELNDLNARDDDDVIEIPVRDLKRAWTAYTKATGGSE